MLRFRKRRQNLPINRIGDYCLDKHIGQGGMSDVYLAHNIKTSQRYAVKLLRAEHGKVDRLLKRFQKEAELVIQLQHPHIIHVFEDGKHEQAGTEYYYIVMEYVEGQNLKQKIRQQGSLLPDLALRYLREVALALEYAHSVGIIHRDIKSANILLNEHDQAILTDFGIAKDIESESELTKAGTALGTAQYMSPEQMNAQGTIDHRTDVYSLGIVLFEMLTGCTPYQGLDVLEIAPKHAQNEPLPPLPQSLCSYQDLFDKMTHRRCEQRMQYVGQVIDWTKRFDNQDATIAEKFGTTVERFDITYFEVNKEHKLVAIGVGDDASSTLKPTKVAFLRGLFDYVMGHNIVLIVVICVLFLSFVLVVLRFQGATQLSINAVSDILPVARHIQAARVLARESKWSLPETPNVLKTLITAFEIEPDNDTIRTDITRVLLYLIDQYKEHDQLDLPVGNNALFMSKLLKEYAKRDIWAPAQIALLTKLIETKRDDDQSARDKLFVYTIELLKLQPDNVQAAESLQQQIQQRERQAHLLAIAGKYNKAAIDMKLLYRVTKRSAYETLSTQWQQQAKDTELQKYVGSFVPISGDCFVMGSVTISDWYRKNEAESQQCVKDFAISTYEVTIGQYSRYCAAVACRLPAVLQQLGSSKPMTHISWHEIMQYVAWLNDQLSAYSFSLPTEQEWEYAARAGGMAYQGYYWGDTMQKGFAHCLNCNAENKLHASTIGTFAPNAWGLYDMLGNVWEWTCSDYREQMLSTTKVAHCNNDSRAHKTIRGGSWLSDAQDIRLAVRYGLLPSEKAFDVGFRLVRRVRSVH